VCGDGSCNASRSYIECNVDMKMKKEEKDDEGVARESNMK